MNEMFSKAAVAYGEMQPVRFILWGGINTVAAYVIYLALYWTLSDYFPSQFAYMASFFVSLIATVILGYFLHCRFTFHVTPWNSIQFHKYYSLYIGTTILNVLLLPLMVESAGVSPEISQGILYVAMPVLSYLGHKKFTFRI